MGVQTGVSSFQLDSLLSILMGIYSQVELLDPIVVLFNILRNAIKSFRVATPSYIPINKLSQFFNILTNVDVFCFMDIYLKGYKMVV